MGLVLDEPTEQDRAVEANGLRFVIDQVLAGHLERFLPLKVDYNERFWQGLRIRTSQATCC